jgi:hypothetical protein
MAQSKEEFLEQFGGDYGYPDAPRGNDELRAAGFKWRVGQGQVLACGVYHS